MLQCKVVIKRVSFEAVVLFITRLTAAITKAILCAGNLTHELMVFKFSYIRNWAVYFDETFTHYI